MILCPSLSRSLHFSNKAGITRQHALLLAPSPVSYQAVLSDSIAKQLTIITSSLSAALAMPAGEAAKVASTSSPSCPITVTSTQTPPCPTPAPAKTTTMCIEPQCIVLETVTGSCPPLPMFCQHTPTVTTVLPCPTSTCRTACAVTTTTVPAGVCPG